MVAHVQVASKANDEAGDGTTTATILTRAFFVDGAKAVAAGMNPMDLRRGIMLAVDTILGELKTLSKSITTSAEIAQVRCVVWCCVGLFLPLCRVLYRVRMRVSPWRR